MLNSRNGLKDLGQANITYPGRKNGTLKREEQ